MAEANVTPAFIDLHAHTTESDGSYTPEDLVALAVQKNLAALAITDHYTFSGYEMANPHAAKAGLPLVRGIELNSRLHLPATSEHRSAHMLGYFANNEPSPAFHRWLQDEQDERRERNRKLAGMLQARGIAVTLAEAEARGRNLTGRVHFAQILVDKRYVDSIESAFQQYLGEGAATYVDRESMPTAAIIERIRSARGIPVLAHPVRLSLTRAAERRVVEELKHAGLAGLEAYHSDQPAELQAYYCDLAQKLDLLVTGGSDFHGRIKPSIELGTGYKGNVRVPVHVLEQLREESSSQVLAS